MSWNSTVADPPPAYTRKDATFAQVARAVDDKSTEINPEFGDTLAAFSNFLASQENVTLTKDQLKILKSQGIYVLEACAKHKQEGGDLSRVLPVITQIFSGVSEELETKTQWEKVIEDPAGVNKLESVIGNAFERLVDQLRQIVRGEDAESTMYKNELEKARENDRKKIVELGSLIQSLAGPNQNLREIIENSMAENLKIIGDRTVGQRRVDAKRSLAILAELTGQSLPPSTLLDKEFVTIGNQAISQGPSYDVFLGEYFTGEKIAIKVLRHRVDQETARITHERFARQAKNWSALRHDCILPFYGIGVMRSSVSDAEFQLYLVSPYLQNQDIRRYLKKYNQAPGAARLQMVFDIADGLKYMHAGSGFDQRQGLVHSALNIFNVLVKDSGRAVISGFGHTKVVEGFQANFTGDNSEYRYMGPEVLDEAVLTYGSDIWSWAMTSLEILTDEPPFGQKTRGTKIIQMVAGDTRPARADHPKLEEYECRDEIWQLFEECWKKKPEDRPSAGEVVRRLKPMVLQQLGKRSQPAVQSPPPPPEPARAPTLHDLGRRDQTTQQAPPLVPGQDQLGKSTAPVSQGGPISGGSQCQGNEWGKVSPAVVPAPPGPQ